MKSPEDILSFWFDEAGPSAWYKKSDEFDALIRSRFETIAIQLAGDLSRRAPHLWENNPASALALIIALDQFPRNMYRSTNAAFAWDALALGAAKRLVAKNHDLKITQGQREFIYMPYMHSENLADQDSCIALVDQRLKNENTLHHAREHRKVIAKFGRFPHRNLSLGRVSTTAEMAYLNSGGYAP
nr:hypothetical protein [uncultured bacterium]AID57600.1 hypothetical protein [uncultured bacterium]